MTLEVNLEEVNEVEYKATPTTTSAFLTELKLNTGSGATTIWEQDISLSVSASWHQATRTTSFTVAVGDSLDRWEYKLGDAAAVAGSGTSGSYVDAVNGNKTLTINGYTNNKLLATATATYTVQLATITHTLTGGPGFFTIDMEFTGNRPDDKWEYKIDDGDWQLGNLVTTSSITISELEPRTYEVTVRLKNLIPGDVLDTSVAKEVTVLPAYGIAGVPYWGQGGTDLIYTDAETLDGGQVLHTDKFEIKSYGSLTVNGDFLIVFAKEEIVINGPLTCRRRSIYWPENFGSTSTIAADCIISRGGGGGGSSGNPCNPAGSRGQDAYYWDTSGNLQTAMGAAGGSGACNAAGSSGASINNGTIQTHNLDWGEIPQKWMYSSETGMPSTIRRHDKRFVNWNIPIETGSTPNNRFEYHEQTLGLVTGRYMYLQKPVTHPDWGAKKLEIPIGIGGFGGWGGRTNDGRGGRQVEGEGGKGGGCIVLVSPLITIGGHAHIDVSGGKGGDSSGSGYYSSGGGGGGGGGMIAIVAQDDVFFTNAESEGLKLQKPSQDTIEDMIPLSVGDASYFRFNRPPDDSSASYRMFDIDGGTGGSGKGWGTTYGGKGEHGCAFIRLVGYHIVETDTGGSTKYAIAFAGLPDLDGDGNALASKTQKSGTANKNNGDKIIEDTLTEAQALERLDYYRGLFTPPVPKVYSSSQTVPTITKYYKAKNWTHGQSHLNTVQAT